jgi:hypothetical protein
MTYVLTYLFLGSATLLPTSLPAIDGELNETFWTTRSRVWVAEDPKLPDNSVRFYLGFDHQYLYFAADVTDANVIGTHSGTRDQVWEDDAVEIFIDFGDGSAIDRTPQSFEYGFSPAGGVNWTRGTSDGSGKNFPAHDWPPQWQSKVQSAHRLKDNTTLNNHGDRDQGYIVEARIPLSEMGVRGPLRPDRKIGVSFLNIPRPEMERNNNKPIVSLPYIDFTNNHSPRLWQRINPDIQGPLAIRGLTEPLPLWLGTYFNSRQWKRFQASQDKPDGPWLNRQAWSAKLKQMQSQNLNALLLLHPHPFNGLLLLANYPGACYFTPEKLKTHSDQFQWLLDEAETNHIKVYLACWNICLPEKWARSQQIKQLRSDTPLSRAYMRSAVAELFHTYPKLAGLAAVTGDRPTGCVDFVIDTVIGGLNEYLKTRPEGGLSVHPIPELILWTKYNNPKQARKIIDSYPNTRLMHDLQYQHWFKPIVDPFMARYETQTISSRTDSPAPAISTVAIGGPQSSQAYLLWSDPQWIWKLTNSLRRQGTDGIFYKSEAIDNLLAREALGIYSLSASDTFNVKRWQKRVNQLYGVDRYAGQLLEAMQHASAIVPRLITLLHDRTDRFMPQLGLPLTHYLELPSLSSYTCAGSSTPQPENVCLTQQWTEQIATIHQEVANTAPPDTTLPSVIAEQIAQHVKTCLSRLTSLRLLKPDHPQQANNLALLLDRIEMNTALGQHYYHKIKAATAWKRYRIDGKDSFDCTKNLARSVDAWRKVVRLADKLFPNNIHYYQSQIVSVPPWTLDQIQHSYRYLEGHWRDQLKIFETELRLVKDRLTSAQTIFTPPLWDTLTAIRQQLLTVHHIEFTSSRDDRLILKEGAKVIKDKELAISGKTLLMADTRTLDQDKWHTIMTTDPDTVTLLANRPYQISFAYRVIDPGTHYPDLLAAGVRPKDSGNKVGQYDSWYAPGGYLGQRFIQIPGLQHDNYIFYLAIHGQAAIAIDALKIETIK